MDVSEPASPQDQSVVVTVRRPVNEYGTMIAEVAETNETRQVVDVVPRIREALSQLPVGTTLPVSMERLQTRGNCWRVTAVGPSGRGPDPSRRRLAPGYEPPPGPQS